MKKTVVLIAVICIISVLFCGCGKNKKADGTDSLAAVTSGGNSSVNNSSSQENTSSQNTSSGSASKTNSSSSKVSMVQGTDDISVSDIEENAVEIDFETGKVISAPSKNTSEPTETFDTPSASSSSKSSSSSSNSSSASSSGNSTSSSNADSERDTMSGFGPWQ